MIGLTLSLLLSAIPPTLIPALRTESKSPSPISHPLNPTTLEQALDRGDLANALSQVERGWTFQYETYYQNKLTRQFLTLSEIQNRLVQLQNQTGKKTALIYQIPSQNHLDLLLILPQGKPIHRRIKAASRTRLTQTLQTFRNSITHSESQPDEYLPAAQTLHQWLIDPIASDLRANTIDTLLFCMGTGLRSLPIAALHDGQKFLIERYNLSLIPAFNLLDHRPAKLAGSQILAMGASEFKTQQPLPAVPLELSSIAQSWPSRSLLNRDFTLENLTRERSRTAFGIIHLATHADISAQSAQDSYLQFWDRPFLLTRMRGLNFRDPLVELLVLSACRTALDSTQAELGFAGLAVQSGAKAAIASLWAVSDSGSLVLMSEFYRALKTAPIKAEALRQAQVAMLRNQVTLKTAVLDRQRSSSPLPEALVQFKNSEVSHPYYWAAFSLIGNPW